MANKHGCKIKNFKESDLTCVLKFAISLFNRVWVDNLGVKKKLPSVYATAPRFNTLKRALRLTYRYPVRSKGNLLFYIKIMIIVK